MTLTIFKTVRRFFPSLRRQFDALPDPRREDRITYPARFLVWLGTLMFCFRFRARRRLRFDLNGYGGLANLNRLAETELDKLAHDDTVANLFKKLPVSALGRVRTEMARNLLRSRTLERFRLLGKFYLVAVDATGFLSFSKRHCKQCLTQQLANGETRYYHSVLEAKLVCDNGMAVSLATEFIVNTDGEKKQDCEIKAFGRLLPRLRKAFPQLSLCLLFDGLYLSKNVMALCRKHHCAYIVTFKEGSAPALYRETDALLSLREQPSINTTDGQTRRCYRWVNDLDHAGNRLHVFECVETRPNQKTTRFRWATNLRVTRANVQTLSGKGGRARWKIENEGFNTQKNGGYALEHAYCEDWNAARNFYFVMQIAHLISQLIEKGNLLKASVRKLFGSISAFVARLLEAWRTVALDSAALEEHLAVRYQIRLDSS